MKECKKKIKAFIKGALFLFIGMALGFALGMYLRDCLAKHTESVGVEVGFLANLLLFAVFILVFYIVFYINIFLHELGHLTFGLLTGYKFSSFRIGGLMLIKLDGKLRLRRYSLVGTGGQCLLSPPEQNDKNAKSPYVLYNLGGVLFNFVSALVSVLLLLTLKVGILLNMLLVSNTAVGIFVCITNGIPLTVGMVDNDGKNALNLGKSKATLEAFYKQMKIAAESTKGTSLREMSDDLFEVSRENEVPDESNAIVKAISVFHCNRLMYPESLKEARDEIEALLEDRKGILELHRRLLICDRIYCALVLVENEADEIVKRLLDAKQKSFMRSMKKYPSVLRTGYAIALIYKKDADMAKKIKDTFDKVSKSYPYRAEITDEKRLIDYCCLINFNKYSKF